MVIPNLKLDKSDQTAYCKLDNQEDNQHSNQPNNETPSNNNLPINSFHSDHQYSHQRNKRVGTIIFLTLLLFSIIALTILFVLSFKLNLNVKQEVWPFIGHHATNKKAPFHLDGHDNDAKLIVKYKLENSNEETTVYRNYRTGYETMKSSNGLWSACYIKKMKLNDMRNSTAITKSLNKQYKSHFYDVIAPPPEAQKGVDRLLGGNAYEDCSQSNIIWIQPMQYEIYVSPARRHSTNTSLANEDHPPDDDDTNYRTRRSIRSCRTTCCWRVCCCNVHHFTWEVAEEFNCNHVCDSCTRHYKSVIMRLCTGV